MNTPTTRMPVKSITKIMLSLGMMLEAGQLLTNGYRSPIPHQFTQPAQASQTVSSNKQIFMIFDYTIACIGFLFFPLILIIRIIGESNTDY